MFETYRKLIARQYEAALCTLRLCIDQCPDELWDTPVGTQPFCRTAFHTLIYADLYLGHDEAGFRNQEFHRENVTLFGDYEQLADREPVALYERRQVRAYLDHCRDKALRIIAGETPESLCGPCGFPRRTFTRAELHVYNIRHIQHHAAQLSLRLRLNTGDGVRWVGSGWVDAPA